MKIVPEHKFDEEACLRLSEASNDEVIKVLPQLLEWLQDYNWPVTPKVHERLRMIGQPLVKPLRDILRGSDGTWKWFIISCFMPALSDSISKQLHEELNRIINDPTETDIKEEVVLEAKEYLNENS